MQQYKKYFGRMNDPIAAAFIKGACGEEIEFYLDIQNKTIKDIRFYTDGCGSILSCGDAVCREAEGLHISEALKISPDFIMKKVSQLPEEESHCAVLATITFYKAIGEYLLAK